MSTFTPADASTLAAWLALANCGLFVAALFAARRSPVILMTSGVCANIWAAAFIVLGIWK